MTAYDDGRVSVHLGDCLDVLRSLPDASVDAVVTDPPYGLGFMGKEWDSGKSFVERKAAKRNTFDHVGGNHNPTSSADAARTRRSESRKFGEWCEDWTAECFRVLKPGGHMLAFGGTRTWHRLACAVEDAGFEVRDSIAWLYGSGFPKSLDVSKAIDKRRDWKSLPLLQAKVREARKTLGISQSEAARRVGLIGPDESLGGGGFMWFETGMRVPTREQYPRLKAALNLDDECDRAFEEAEREVLSSTTTSRTIEGSWAGQVASGMFREGERTVAITAPATPDAERWQGWGSAMKPGFEPVVVARKPLIGTIAQNVLTYGTGALNIDATRIGANEWDDGGSLCASCAALAGQSERPTAPARRASTATRRAAPTSSARGATSPAATRKAATGCSDGTRAGATSTSSSTEPSGSSTTDPSPLATNGSSTTSTATSSTTGSRTCTSCGEPITRATTTSGQRAGRWPSNVVLDESQAAALDEQSGERAAGGFPETVNRKRGHGVLSDFTDETRPERIATDTGGASRFFYVAKAPATERPRVDGTAHPTVKPLDLMRWLVRLVTPPGGTVLEPFAGSGTTVEACIVEGFRCIAIEREADYLPLILQRIHRRRDPVAAIRQTGDDLGLFELEGEPA